MDKPNISIAVIGKSSSGKSAFIKSFSKCGELISSEGKGQTTRSYVEYKFYKNNLKPEVYIKIMAQQEFTNIRISQFFDKLKSLQEENNEEFSCSWLQEQFSDVGYKKEIDSFILYSDDFFNINEFYFLDEGETIEKIKLKYDEFVEKILTIEEEKAVNEEHDEYNTVDKELKQLFDYVYNIIIEAINEKYIDDNILENINNDLTIQFEVTEDLKDTLTLFLKVEDIEGHKKSLSSIVSKVRINSTISQSYLKILEKLEVDTVTLLDTYGLDHAESCSDEVLRERYKRIFTKDYPDIAYVFFIEALHSGSSKDFTKALKTLYNEKPEIMTYVIGTYIDEQDASVLNEFENWLVSLEKDENEVPPLNGKVLDYLFESNSIENALRRQNIHQTLAKKRLEIMKKRFGVFCGNKEKAEEEFFEKINLVTIEALLISIVNQEHLGDEYINIDKILKFLDNQEDIIPIIQYMVEFLSERFNKIFSQSASRTTWKIRENIERCILGFDGSTLDATWFRVFNDAYNSTFSKEIKIDGKTTSLAQVFNLLGNERIAFDELINGFFPYLFIKKCENKETLPLWNHEINCIYCYNKNEFSQECIWGMFIDLVKPENFKKSQDYTRIYRWLITIHNFKEKYDYNFLNKVTNYFCLRIKESFIPICRKYNINVAGKIAKQSSFNYQEEKYRIFEEYKKKFDSEVDFEVFFRGMN